LNDALPLAYVAQIGHLRNHFAREHSTSR
jgi:hypothetical protein